MPYLVILVALLVIGLAILARSLAEFGLACSSRALGREHRRIASLTVIPPGSIPG